MPGWIIPIIIILIAVVSRVMKAVRQSQEKTQGKRRPAAATRTKSLSERLGFDTDFDTASPTRSRSPTQPTAPRIESEAPWEFEWAKEMPEQDTRRKTPDARHKSLESLIDESAVPDEEAFKEETVAQTQPSEHRSTASRGRSEPAVLAKHEPIRIAGIPLTSQTIRQGVIITEILKRPEF